MLSLLLVAGAASGEFLTPIKSHHHQESLNLKESSGEAPNPRKNLHRRFEENGGHDANGAHGACVNCDGGCHNCKEHKEHEKAVLSIMADKMNAIRAEQREAKQQQLKNKEELTALGLVQADDKAKHDERSSKLRTAWAAKREAANASSSTETSQASSSSMGAHASQPVRESVFAYAPPPQNQGYQGSFESSSRGSMFSAPGVTRPGVIYAGPGSSREHGGFPIQHQGFQGSHGGALDLSSRSTSAWDPSGKFRIPSSRSTVTSSTGGFGFGGVPDCMPDKKTSYECLCKTSKGVQKAKCYAGQTCKQSQDTAHCEF